MESNKIVLIMLFLGALASCSIVDPLYEDGWKYIKENDFSRAHAKFQKDIKEFPDSLDIVGGLSYTYFAFGFPESSKIYLDSARILRPDNNICIFLSLLYFRNYPDSASKDYRIFVSKHSSYPLYAVRDVIKSNTIHKLGLTNEIKMDSFLFAYDVLKSITDISDSLDLSSSTDRFIMIEYINNLEE